MFSNIAKVLQRTYLQIQEPVAYRLAQVTTQTGADLLSTMNMKQAPVQTTQHTALAIAVREAVKTILYDPKLHYYQKLRDRILGVGNTDIVSDDRIDDRLPALLHDPAFAQAMDMLDPLREYRKKFLLPKDLIEFRGNSLGVQPEGFQQGFLDQQWIRAEHSHEGHFVGEHPRRQFHKQFQPLLARLVGAHEGEVVPLESLSANNVQLLQKFYHAQCLKDPTKNKILIEEWLFPSDYNNVLSTLALCNGISEQQAENLIVRVKKSEKWTIDVEEVQKTLAANTDVGVIFMWWVNYYTGQLLDMKWITAAGHAQWCKILFDLAHAAWNIPLELHERGVDAAAGCGYKYLNGGPGSTGWTFIHEKNFAIAESLVGGWWWRAENGRFTFDVTRPTTFVAGEGAVGMQRSNFPIFNSLALLTSLKIFDEVGMEALRKKSKLLTWYAEWLLRHHLKNKITIITPTDPEQRGAQLSFKVQSFDTPDWAKQLQKLLEEKSGIVEKSAIGCEQRDDVIRIAPVPLYNTYEEVFRFVQTLRDIVFTH